MALFFSFNHTIIISLYIQFIYYNIDISNSIEIEFISANSLINKLTNCNHV